MFSLLRKFMNALLHKLIRAVSEGIHATITGAGRAFGAVLGGLVISAAATFLSFQQGWISEATFTQFLATLLTDFNREIGNYSPLTDSENKAADIASKDNTYSKDLQISLTEVTSSLETLKMELNNLVPSSKIKNLSSVASVSESASGMHNVEEENKIIEDPTIEDLIKENKEKQKSIVSQIDILKKYKRKDWRYWIDSDGDCLDTRNEVLQAESLEPAIIERCQVVAGYWEDKFSGKIFTDPKEIDISHIVPLKEVHISGGADWSPEKKERYANDLTLNETLIAVSSSATKSKGSKTPAQWMPPNEKYHCEYISAWEKVKEKWELIADPAEKAAIEKIRLAKSC